MLRAARRGRQLDLLQLRTCQINHLETEMPKYLLEANYVGDGVKGLLADGGSKRRAAAAKAIKSLGGKLEAFYFAFGDVDAFLIADMPDNATAAGMALAISATGAVRVKTTVLLTPEEIDAGSRKKMKYRAPGK
jgi:uncharacterized protein with GYD domain